MTRQVVVGAAVQTPFGKGTVLEARNAGRWLVQVKGRALLLAESQLTAAVGPKVQTHSRAREVAAGPEQDGSPPRLSPNAGECDLHGCTVDQALARIDEALNHALLQGMPVLRFIHGRSGGRLKCALHARLREVPSVRGFHVDEGNAGVTVVKL